MAGGRWCGALRCAVLRYGQDHDARRSGALFGARVGAAGGTYSIGCRARFCVPCSRDGRASVLAPVAAPRHFRARSGPRPTRPITTTLTPYVGYGVDTEVDWDSPPMGA
jgi:hypothetical protein